MAIAVIRRLRRYRFDWKLSLLTALLFPLMVSLGFWQLRREAEKLALQETYSSRQHEAAVELASLDLSQDQQYRQVKIEGRFDEAHLFLLDNRIYQGQVGYEAVVPLIEPDGTLVLVNRGWIAQGSSRENLPTVAPVPGSIAITGSVYQPVGETLVLGADVETAGWPKVIQTLEPRHLAELAGYSGDKVFPYSVRVSEGAPGALVRYWPVISTKPEMHRGYAVQWFLMATALIMLYLFYSTKTDVEPTASNTHDEHTT